MKVYVINGLGDNNCQHLVMGSVGTMEEDHASHTAIKALVANVCGANQVTFICAEKTDLKSMMILLEIFDEEDFSCVDVKSAEMNSADDR
jgi:hypothetical protein